ncbi:uncharacterized protein F4812DRAFT_459775 [Daldinia caldariorum]|uniref:uncharacterized protein n=1 Tax=Daldinia caldariorum TaxID=326644 RepID=UPI0020081ACA|nr:uncharacterized protein F4812DRAFT_459775 [Daldinia caldariorum]KAI1467671.1 hypothetical protein F4812DRAFT_459775 [Daldinia caldariorum]
MAAFSRATSLLLSKSVNVRCSQKLLCHFEPSTLTSPGFDKSHLLNKAIYNGMSLTGHTSPDTNGFQNKQPLTAKPLGIIPTSSLGTAVPLVHSTIPPQQGKTTTTTKVWDAHKKDTTPPLALRSYSYASGTNGVPLNRNKTFAGRRYKAQLDIMQDQKCLRSSMDDFLVQLWSIIVSGFHPALVYMGAVMLTISLSTIIMALSIIFFY